MIQALVRNAYRLKNHLRIRVRINRHMARRRLNRTTPEEILSRYLKETPAGARGINLACGTVPIKGWLNVDFDRPEHVDVLWDLRRKLTFVPDNTFDFVYHEHFMEHIDRKSALVLACECLRILRPGGRIRIAMPDLDKVIRDYAEDRKHPHVHEEFRQHYGELFHTKGELFDIAIRGWGHTYLYNYEDLASLLKAAGFGDTRRAAWGSSDVQFLSNRESRGADESGLIAEASKSAGGS